MVINTATDSKDANKEVMNCRAEATYVKEDNKVTITLGDIKCIAMNGDMFIPVE